MRITVQIEMESADLLRLWEEIVADAHPPRNTRAVRKPDTDVRKPDSVTDGPKHTA